MLMPLSCTEPMDTAMLPPTPTTDTPLMPTTPTLILGSTTPLPILPTDMAFIILARGMLMLMPTTDTTDTDVDTTAIPMDTEDTDTSEVTTGNLLLAALVFSLLFMKSKSSTANKDFSLAEMFSAHSLYGVGIVESKINL